MRRSLPTISPRLCSTSPASLRSPQDRKSTRLNSNHSQISYAVFCLKKKKKIQLVVTSPLSVKAYPIDLPELRLVRLYHLDLAQTDSSTRSREPRGRTDHSLVRY